MTAPTIHVLKNARAKYTFSSVFHHLFLDRIESRTSRNTRITARFAPRPDLWEVILKYRKAPTSDPGFRMSLSNAVSIGSFSATPRATKQSHSILFTWRDVRRIDPTPGILGYVTLDLVQLTVELPSSSSIAFWTVRVKHRSPFHTLYKVVLPVATLDDLAPPSVQHDEVMDLVVSMRTGRIFHDIGATGGSPSLHRAERPGSPGAHDVPYPPGARPPGPRPKYLHYTANPVNTLSHPGLLSVQLAGYQNKRRGAFLYLGTHDARGYFKDYSFPGMEDRHFRTFQITHFPSRASAATRPVVEDYTTPYPVLLGILPGDWWDAAKFYRTWAVEQDFARGQRLFDRVRAGTFPWSLVDTDIYLYMHDGGKPGVWARDVVQLADYCELDNIMCEWHWPFLWDLVWPEYGHLVEYRVDGQYDLRRRGPIPRGRGYDSAIARVLDDGHRVSSYLNPLVPVDKLYANAVPELWRKHDFDKAVRLTFDGSSIDFRQTVNVKTLPLPAELLFVRKRPCVFTAKFHDLIREVVCKYRRSLEATGIYLDVISGGQHLPDWVPSGFGAGLCYGPDWIPRGHEGPADAPGRSEAHPPGGGDYGTTGIKNTLRTVREALTRENPRAEDFWISSEYPQELFIPDLDLSHMEGPPPKLEPLRGIDARMLPIMSAVYHDYHLIGPLTSPAGTPPTFADAQAWQRIFMGNIMHGLIPGHDNIFAPLFGGTGLFSPTMSKGFEDYPAARPYWDSIRRLLQLLRIARTVTAMGERVRDVPIPHTLVRLPLGGDRFLWPDLDGDPLNDRYQPVYYATYRHPDRRSTHHANEIAILLMRWHVPDVTVPVETSEIRLDVTVWGLDRRLDYDVNQLEIGSDGLVRRRHLMQFRGVTSPTLRTRVRESAILQIRERLRPRPEDGLAHRVFEMPPSPVYHRGAYGVLRQDGSVLSFDSQESLHHFMASNGHPRKDYFLTMKDVSERFLRGRAVVPYHSIPALAEHLVGATLCFRFGRALGQGAARRTGRGRVRGFEVVRENGRVVLQEYLPFHHGLYAKLIQTGKRVLWGQDGLIDVLPRGDSRGRRFGNYGTDVILGWDRAAPPAMRDRRPPHPETPIDPFLPAARVC